MFVVLVLRSVWVLAEPLGTVGAGGIVLLLGEGRSTGSRRRSHRALEATGA